MPRLAPFVQWPKTASIIRGKCVFGACDSHRGSNEFFKCVRYSWHWQLSVCAVLSWPCYRKKRYIQISKISSLSLGCCRHFKTCGHYLMKVEVCQDNLGAACLTLSFLYCLVNIDLATANRNMACKCVCDRWVTGERRFIMGKSFRKYRHVGGALMFPAEVNN